MRSWVGCVGLAFGLIACGQSSQGSSQAPGGMTSVGAGSGSGGSGATTEGGAVGSTLGGTGTNASGGEPSAGHSSTSGMRGEGGEGGDSTGQCEPMLHERQQPGPLTSDFATVVSELSGVYLIDAVYQQVDGDCSAMCPSGTSYASGQYIYVNLEPGDVQATISTCVKPFSCQSGSVVDIGYLGTAISDRILEGYMTSSSGNKDIGCSGRQVNSWLISTGPDKIRIDNQHVLVPPFPVPLEDGQYFCRPRHVEERTEGLPCSELVVIDATFVEK